jgi:hypothetical protein
MTRHRTPTRLILGAALALAAPAAAAASDSGPVIFGDSTLTGNVNPIPDKIDCASTPGVCELYFHGSGTWAGSFVGTDQFTIHGHLQTDLSFAYQSVGKISGALAGWGTGTFTAVSQGVLSQIDLQQLALAGHAEGNIVPGSGTGAFTGATTLTDYEIVTQHLDGTVVIRDVGSATCPTTAEPPTTTTPRNRAAHHHHHAHHNHHAQRNRSASASNASA